MVMRGLDRKLLRDIAANWQMILAISSIIAVGIGCFTGMLSAARNLELARSSYYSSCRLADFWLDVKKLPLQEVEHLTSLPGVSEIRSRIQFPVTLHLPDVIKPIGAMVLSLPDTPAPVINDIVLRTGSYFSADRKQEVIVSEKFAKARNIHAGDTIKVILHNQLKDLLVVGTAISAEFVYTVSPGSVVDEPGSYGLLYIKRSWAEEIFGFSGAANSLVGLLAPESKERAEEVVKALSDRLDEYGVSSAVPRDKQFSPMVLDGELKQLNNMAYIFPLFFLSVAALVQNVLMVRMVQQQRTVIGTFKALGYHDRVLLVHYLKFATVAGFVGGVLGGLLGYWLGEVTTQMYTIYFSFPLLAHTVYPDVFSAGILLSLFFAIAGTVRGVSRIMKMIPAEAMREAPPQQGGRVFLEKIQPVWNLFDAQWHMILRGLIRNRSRTCIGLFSAAMGSSIVVLAFGFVDSMDEMISTQFQRVLTSDYHLSFTTEINDKVVAEIKRLPGVILAEPVFIVPCTFRLRNHHKKGAIMGILSDGILTSPVLDDGSRMLIPATGLVMAERLMAQLEIHASDVVGFVPIKGEKRRQVVEVAAGTHSMLGLAVYADYHWLNRLMGQQGGVSEVRIRVSHDSSAERDFLAAIGKLKNIETISDLKQQKISLVRQFDTAMRAMAVIMILFAAVIFFGTILNGTLIALSERSREMATMRTMGYYNHEVARLFLRENLVINVAGALFGLPLGYWLLTASMQEFVTDAYSYPAVLYPKSCFLTIMLAVIFVLISQLVVVRRIKQQNWLEAISLKE